MSIYAKSNHDLGVTLSRRPAFAIDYRQSLAPGLNH